MSADYSLGGLPCILAISMDGFGDDAPGHGPCCPVRLLLMPAGSPTILASSSDLRRGARSELLFNALLLHAIELAGVSGRAPRLCHIGTARGDQRFFQAWFTEAGRAAGIDVSHLNLFPMPSVYDTMGLLLDQDVIWVGGGSVANLLALWRLHGLDRGLREAWEAGVVLTGFSAGSICWHLGGTTDSFGPDLRPVTNGLGFLPWSNCVHYDSEPQRRAAYHALVGDRTLPGGYAIDDGVGLLYRGVEITEALADIPGKGAYRVTLDGNQVLEERIEPRLLRIGGLLPVGSATGRPCACATNWIEN
jgi:peptidase E